MLPVPVTVGTRLYRSAGASRSPHSALRSHFYPASASAGGELYFSESSGGLEPYYRARAGCGRVWSASSSRGARHYVKSESPFPARRTEGYP